MRAETYRWAAAASGREALLGQAHSSQAASNCRAYEAAVEADPEAKLTRIAALPALPAERLVTLALRSLPRRFAPRGRDG